MDFEEMVTANQARVYSLALHFLRNQARAEEVAQEVFLELYRNLDAIESGDHLRHWLRVVTSRRCLDEGRRRKFEPPNWLDQVAAPAAEPETGDPILSGLLERLVGALPEQARLAVILRYQEDLEPAEIARVLNMPVATVKSHLHRSLDLLRCKLERLGANR